MSIYPKETKEDLINLRKLAEQQKNQQALKIKNRTLKQTHDIKLTESLSPDTKKLDEFNDSTQKFGGIVKKNTPQQARENTHIALPIENEQLHPGVIYDTSIENTLTNMKNVIDFFIIEERDNVDDIWNGFPVEKWVVINLKLKRSFMI